MLYHYRTMGFFLKNSNKLNDIPKSTTDKGLLLAYQMANKFNWSEQELGAYDYLSMRGQDERGKVTLVKMKLALAEQELQQEKELVKEAKKQAKETKTQLQQEKKRAEHEKINIVQNLIASGMDNVFIAQITGFSLEMTQKIREPNAS